MEKRKDKDRSGSEEEEEWWRMEERRHQGIYWSMYMLVRVHTD